MAASMHEMNTLAINTYKGDGDKTYYSDKASSHIDFVFVPKAALTAVDKVQVLWRIWAKTPIDS